jgi:hypothetical protein
MLTETHTQKDDGLNLDTKIDTNDLNNVNDLSIGQDYFSPKEGHRTTGMASLVSSKKNFSK